MRQTFLLLIVAIVVVSLAVGAIYLVLRSLLDVYDDWQIGKEMKELEGESSDRREQRQHEHEERLQNGCDHQWEGSLVDFPPGACNRCGLEKELPNGSCDHVWKVDMQEQPIAVCEGCGKKYQRAATTI